MRTIDDFAMLAPMKYYNNEAAVPKRTDMIENKDNLYIGSEKHDGDWGMFIHKTKGDNLIRSRSISTVTGVYGDYTAKLPHLVEEMDTWPDNTVVLAEICWDEYGTNANTVGTILRCLPAKAVERQKEKKLRGLIFDVLMVAGEDFTQMGYADRLKLIDGAYEGALYGDEGSYHLTGTYFKRTNIFTDDFQRHADEIIRAGGEGIVIQMKSNPYMPGTRTAWKTLKLKQKMESAEYLVIGTIEPNKYYDGICSETWKYWEVVFDYGGGDNAIGTIETEGGSPVNHVDIESAVAVTKPYYYGWKNGITIMLPSGIETDVASGLTDEDREWLATGEAQEAIAKHNVYAEVAAMSVNDLGKLRHAYLIRLRTKEDGANE